MNCPTGFILVPGGFVRGFTSCFDEAWNCVGLAFLFSPKCTGAESKNALEPEERWAAVLRSNTKKDKDKWSLVLDIARDLESNYLQLIHPVCLGGERIELQETNLCFGFDYDDVSIHLPLITKSMQTQILKIHIEQCVLSVNLLDVENAETKLFFQTPRRTEDQEEIIVPFILADYDVLCDDKYRSLMYTCTSLMPWLGGLCRMSRIGVKVSNLRQFSDQTQQKKVICSMGGIEWLYLLRQCQENSKLLQQLSLRDWTFIAKVNSDPDVFDADQTILLIKQKLATTSAEDKDLLMRLFDFQITALLERAIVSNQFLLLDEKLNDRKEEEEQEEQEEKEEEKEEEESSSQDDREESEDCDQTVLCCLQ